jgi:hypothetical protein
LAHQRRVDEIAEACRADHKKLNRGYSADGYPRGFDPESACT